MVLCQPTKIGDKFFQVFCTIWPYYPMFFCYWVNTSIALLQTGDSTAPSLLGWIFCALFACNSATGWCGNLLLSQVTILATYVDDILVATESREFVFVNLLGEDSSIQIIRSSKQSTMVLVYLYLKKPKLQLG